MSIQVLWSKFKCFFHDTEVLLTILIIVVSVASFVLGRFSVTSTHETTVTSGVVLQSATSAATIESTARSDGEVKNVPHQEKGYVASKSGTKYHLPWCGSAKRIKEENRIWFATKEEAEAAGYTPASTCKGM